MEERARRRSGGIARAAVDRYLDLLKSGGSDHPMTLLQAAGVDLSKPEPCVPSCASSMAW